MDPGAEEVFLAPRAPYGFFPPALFPATLTPSNFLADRALRCSGSWKLPLEGASLWKEAHNRLILGGGHVSGPDEGGSIKIFVPSRPQDIDHHKQAPFLVSLLIRFPYLLAIGFCAPWKSIHSLQIRFSCVCFAFSFLRPFHPSPTSFSPLLHSTSFYNPLSSHPSGSLLLSSSPLVERADSFGHSLFVPISALVCLLVSVCSLRSVAVITSR